MSLPLTPGVFNWVDLSTTDPVDGKDYYFELLGWSHQDVPTGPNSSYTRLLLGDKEVGSLSRMPASMEALGIPSHWMCYLSVDNIEATAEKIVASGGRIAGGPFQAEGRGRMAICSDPTGAHFAIWEAQGHPGALVHTNGAMSWHELLSTDPAVSQTFFESVFGWQGTAQTLGPQDYMVFYLSGTAVAGMTPMPEHFHGFPSWWTVYFMVKDCVAATKDAREFGGKLLAGPTTVEGLGVFSVLEDPQHAIFGLISYGTPE